MGLAPGLKGAIARGINSNGEIVGYGFVTPGTFAAWRHSATGVLSVISSVGVTAAVAEDINRKSTGAIVDRQPFGGFKLSGIGSKAGGPDYLLQFVLPRVITENTMRRGFAPEADGAANTKDGE